MTRALAPIRHLLAPGGGGEYSFCGDAFDIFESGDADEYAEFMDEDDLRPVTCPRCCQAIREIRAAIKGRKLRPDGGDT